MAIAIGSEYVELGLGKERYALPIHGIQEIIRMQTITDIPYSRPELRGVINLRGKIVPVICLGKRLNVEANGLSPLTRIVIVPSKEASVGLIVDRVFRVVTYAEIQPPPEGIGAAERALISGIGRKDEHMACLLNIEAILSQGGVPVG